MPKGLVQAKQADSIKGESMSKGPASFRVSDLRRAIRGTRSAGVEVARVEVEGGKITIIPAAPDHQEIRPDSAPRKDIVL